MKKIVWCLLLGLQYWNGLAQDFPTYGIVSGEERSMKVCAFDPEAEAVILLHEAVSDHDDQYRLITNHHVKLKVLRESGIDRADIHIPFYSNDGYEMVRVVKATAINTDETGRVTLQELDRKTIFRKNINKYYSEIVFSFAGVKVGTIIEYIYESNMQSYGGLDSWEFQQDIPVLKSYYNLTILPGHEFAYFVQKSENLPIVIKQDKNSGRISFEMNNIPALRSEPFMDARKDYLQMVRFQLSGVNVTYKRKYMTSWKEVIREMSQHSNFGNQIGKSLDGTDEFLTQLKSEPSATARLTRIYNYVRSSMNWNRFTSLYASDGIKRAWSKKTGTSGEINLILTTILKDAGIEAYPMLVSERQHGKVSVQHPFVDQFNTVYAYAVADGKKYYLDATDRNTPAHIIPNTVLNTTALVVDKKSGGIIQIKDESLTYKSFINISATVTNEGLKGSVFMRRLDYARSSNLASYRQNPAGYMKNLRSTSNSLDIDSFRIRNEETDSLPLEQTFVFRSGLNATGEYSFVPTNLFFELGANPFLSKVRFSNVNFGYKQELFVNSFFTLPEGSQVDALPKSIRLTTENKDIVFVRQVTYDEKKRQVYMRMSIELAKSEYTPDEYDALQEFYKKMYDFVNEPIVLKKS